MSGDGSLWAGPLLLIVRVMWVISLGIFLPRRGFQGCRGVTLPAFGTGVCEGLFPDGPQYIESYPRPAH
jgi:hypothetical protein